MKPQGGDQDDGSGTNSCAPSSGRTGKGPGLHGKNRGPSHPCRAGKGGESAGAPVRPCGEKDAEGNARNGTEKIRLAFARRILWCKRWDLNPHGGCHTHLKRACLPIPTLLQLRAVPNSLPIIPFFHPVVNSFFPLWREIPPETGKQNPKGSRGEIILDLWFRGWYSYSNPGKNRTFPKSSPA